MDQDEASEADPTYPVRVVARMTGMKPELIRAWESRYGAVRPGRTTGGSRRYSDSDLGRLRLLREAVEAGHRIGRIARLSSAELRQLLPDQSTTTSDPIDRILEALTRLDAVEARRLLAEQVQSLGPVDFARSLVLPLLVEVGERWKQGELGIPTEHLATDVIRSMLLPMVESVRERSGGPRIILATPSGESHDVGTLVAAVIAVHAGAEAIYLGADVPVEDLARTAVESRASAVAIGVVTLSTEAATEMLVALRSLLPEKLPIWIGGAGIDRIEPLNGIDRIANLDQLEANVTLLDAGIADASGALSGDSPAEPSKRGPA